MHKYTVLAIRMLDRNLGGYVAPIKRRLIDNLRPICRYVQIGIVLFLAANLQHYRYPAGRVHSRCDIKEGPAGFAYFI